MSKKTCIQCRFKKTCIKKYGKKKNRRLDTCTIRTYFLLDEANKIYARHHGGES